MHSISARLAAVNKRIEEAAIRAGRNPAGIRLVAASKTRPPSDLHLAFAAGQRAFGENYLQEALEKQEALADLPLEWHFMGRLQSNKTRAIASHFSWVHSVSNLKHARRLGEQRPPTLPPLNVCLQVNISDEESKDGIGLEALPALAAAVAGLPRLRLRGLMALPAPTSDERVQRAAFKRLRELQQALISDGLALDTLSMGMSDDLEAAIAEGATIVRIGTAIFGPRSPVKARRR